MPVNSANSLPTSVTFPGPKTICTPSSLSTTPKTPSIFLNEAKSIFDVSDTIKRRRVIHVELL